MKSLLRAPQSLAPLTLSAVLLALTSWFFHSYTMDDALTTLRYALNLRTHGSPTWNALGDSEPTMGFTSPVWVVLNAVAAWLTTDKDTLVLVAKALGYVAALGMAAIVLRAGARGRPGLRAALGLSLLVFASPVWGFLVASAMETLLFCCGVVLFVYLAAEERPTRSSSRSASGSTWCGRRAGS